MGSEMCIRDSIKSIYDCVIQEAMTYKYGGGCGHDLSVLRPGGDEILGTGGNSCGPVGFMNLFSENTNTIAQHGRRGANMQTLRVDHPDIEKFIEIKTGDVDKVKYSNISVLLTDDFMDAVQSDSDFDLHWGGKTYTTVKAKELWMKIIEHAHASAEFTFFLLEVVMFLFVYMYLRYMLYLKVLLREIVVLFVDSQSLDIFQE